MTTIWRHKKNVLYLSITVYTQILTLATLTSAESCISWGEFQEGSSNRSPQSQKSERYSKWFFLSRNIHLWRNFSDEVRICLPASSHTCITVAVLTVFVDSITSRHNACLTLNMPQVGKHAMQWYWWKNHSSLYWPANTVIIYLTEVHLFNHRQFHAKLA